LSKSAAWARRYASSYRSCRTKRHGEQCVDEALLEVRGFAGAARQAEVVARKRSPRTGDETELGDREGFVEPGEGLVGCRLAVFGVAPASREEVVEAGQPGPAVVVVPHGVDDVLAAAHRPGDEVSVGVLDEIGETEGRGDAGHGELVVGKRQRVRVLLLGVAPVGPEGHQVTGPAADVAAVRLAPARSYSC
jgi:hypothetical protein